MTDRPTPQPSPLAVEIARQFANALAYVVDHNIVSEAVEVLARLRPTPKQEGNEDAHA